MSETASETTAPQQAQDAPQEQPKTFDAEYVANLRKEAARYRTEAKANAEAARKLAEVEQRDMSELEKLQKALADERAQREQSEAAALRQSVALAKKLPLELVDRLRGATREELEADAEALLALVNGPRRMQPDFSQGAQSPAPLTPEQEFAAFRSSL